MGRVERFLFKNLAAIFVVSDLRRKEERPSIGLKCSRSIRFELFSRKVPLRDLFSFQGWAEEFSGRCSDISGVTDSVYGYCIWNSTHERLQ